MRIEITPVDAGAAQPLPSAQNARRGPEPLRGTRRRGAAVSLRATPTAWTSAPVRWDAVREYATKRSR